MNVLVFADNHEGSIAKSAFETASYGAKIAADSGGNAAIITYGNLNDKQLNDFKKLMQLFLSTDGYQKVNEIAAYKVDEL